MSQKAGSSTEKQPIGRLRISQTTPLTHHSLSSAVETDPKGFKALLDFTREHGQSLDYVLSGELDSLFCMLAAISPRRI